MPGPSLSELMQFVNASQQMPYLDTFMNTEKHYQDKAYKQAQMDKIIQDMKLAEMMAPADLAHKQALTRQSGAQAGSVEQSTSEAQAIATPENLMARSQAPQLANQISDAQLTGLGHKNYQDSLKSNEEMRKAQFINDFMTAPDETTRRSVAESDPEMWLKLQELMNQEKRARMQAQSGGRGPTNEEFWRNMGTSLGLKGTDLSDYIKNQIAGSSASSWGQTQSLGQAPSGAPMKMIDKAPQGAPASSGQQLTPEQRARLIQMLQGK